MKALSIRGRLAIWYAAVLGATLSLFAVISFEAISHSMITAVDEDLQAQATGFQKLLSRTSSHQDLVEQFLEHSASGDLIQLADMSGNWIYRSPAVEPLSIGMRPVAAGEDHYETVQLHHATYRVLSAGVRIGTSNYRLQLAQSLASYNQTVKRLTEFMALSIPVLLLASTAGGYWLSRRALTTVDQITNRARTISEENLSDRLPVPPARDELQRLATTLNDMLDRIEQAFQRNARFTADASHELRSPLTLIRATAEICGRQSRSESEYREALARIVAETTKTTEMVESLLTLARADAGSERLEKEPIDLREVVIEACARGQTIAQAKGLNWEVHLPPAPVWITANQNAIHRLLMTVIDNGVKYTRTGGTVKVQLARREEAAVVSVIDTGIGISESDLPHIFERFYRADRARSRAEGGAGLGLAIARWIVEAHQGSIVCRSVPGAGSTFEVRLPLTSISVQSAFRIAR